MRLSHLLAKIRPALWPVLEDLKPEPDASGRAPCILFFSVCNGAERTHIEIARATTWELTWAQGVQALERWQREQKLPLRWLRVDAVSQVHALTWGGLQQRLIATKRNYFARGIAFDAEFKHAVLPLELGANALLYNNQETPCTPHAVNLRNYGKRRFGTALSWPEQAEQSIWTFSTRAVFSDGEAVHPIEHEGRHAGYRQVPDWGCERVLATVHTANDFLARQVKSAGEYHYGWFPCFDRAIPHYNTLRHASSTYALLEGWELTRSDSDKAAIDRALEYLTRHLIVDALLPNGETAAFLVDTGDEIKLGGNAVCLLALAKYTELTGDRQHLPLMERLALGIGHMQDPATGRFVHVLNHPDLSLKAEHRIIYYDGEAAFGLMRLYGLTRDPRWLAMVEKAFDHFIAAKHWQAHDHWLSYCVNELTLYKPDERYYRFGLDNVSGHLDFVIQRITTFPTLLELMMAAQKMVERLQADPERAHLLDGFDLAKFHHALEVRARYLLNGFFWPEVAMFFKHPNRIVGGFFIRHHSFRVRIDDVEHYVSGYVAYWKYLQSRRQTTLQPPVPRETKRLDASVLQEVTGGRWLVQPPTEWHATGACIWPPSFQAGDLLFARGSRDVGGYVSDISLKRLAGIGASGIVTDDANHVLALGCELPVLQVPSVGDALLKIGHFARTAYNGTVWGVTGSAGKTTTVAMLAQALRAFGEVGETQASANLPKGIAWNLASMPSTAPHWVLEMAIGSMSQNSALVQPNVAIVTNVGPAHLEFHGSVDTIAERKARIYEGMSAGGVAVIWRDMGHHGVFAEAARRRGLQVRSYGFSPESDVHLSIQGDRTICTFTDTRQTLVLPAWPQHLQLNAAAVIAAMQAVGLDMRRGLASLMAFQPISGRGRELTACLDGKIITLIDDAYNANPLSMRAALSSLVTSTPQPEGRVAVLGDMLELGKTSRQHHLELLQAVIEANPDRVLLCGNEMLALWQALEPMRAGQTLRGAWFANSQALQEALPGWLQTNDRVLVKGSHGTGLHALIDTLSTNIPPGFANDRA